VHPPQSTGSVSAADASSSLGWNVIRVQAALRPLLAQGMVWVDEQAGGIGSAPCYWFPSLWSVTTAGLRARAGVSSGGVSGAFASAAAPIADMEEDEAAAELRDDDDDGGPDGGGGGGDGEV
jgi:hypothetical protein